MRDDGIEERPYWLPGPCPSWCLGDHDDMEDWPLDLRVHLSGSLQVVPLSTMDPIEVRVVESGRYRPWYLAVRVEQGLREIGPRIVLEDETGTTKISFTPSEAQQIVDAVVDAIRIATGSEVPRA